MLNKKQLIEIGFADKEAMVYLALLEMGPSTVSEIGRQAKINRTTGYDIVEMLCSKGLANALGEGSIKKYVAENPEKIIALSQAQFEEAKNQFEASKKLLPELKSIFQKAEKPRVKFYEGKEEMKQAFRNIGSFRRQRLDTNLTVPFMLIGLILLLIEWGLMNSKYRSLP